jgi:uncharacterized protein YndB with AHSA1/START domain
MERSVEINAPSERVWAVLSDVERWPAWTPTTTSVVMETPPPFAVGSRATLELRGQKQPSVWEVTELTPGRSFTREMRAGPGLRVVAGHVIEPLATGCRVTLSIVARGPLSLPVRPFIERMSADNVETEAASLKRRCEEVASPT